MKNGIKRNVTISIMTICLLLLMLTGSTYALFTSQDSVNMVVSSANVKVEAEITDFKTYSLDVKQGEVSGVGTATFELGGTATLDTDGALNLTHVAPGDKVEFTLSILNTSNITILQRVRILSTTTDQDAVKLLGGLNITIAGKAYGFNEQGEFCNKVVDAAGTVTYTALDINSWASVNAMVNSNINVTVELPKSAGNEYQNLTWSLQVIVEAYQGNASEADLKALV